MEVDGFPHMVPSGYHSFSWWYWKHLKNRIFQEFFFPALGPRILTFTGMCFFIDFIKIFSIDLAGPIPAEHMGGETSQGSKIIASSGLFHGKSFYKCMINGGIPIFGNLYMIYMGPWYAMVDRLYRQIGGWPSTRDLYSQERLRFPIWDRWP